MVRGMTRRVDRGDPPAGALDDIAIADGDVGRKIAVGALLDALQNEVKII